MKNSYIPKHLLGYFGHEVDVKNYVREPKDMAVLMWEVEGEEAGHMLNPVKLLFYAGFPDYLLRAECHYSYPTKIRKCQILKIHLIPCV